MVVPPNYKHIKISLIVQQPLCCGGTPNNDTKNAIKMNENLLYKKKNNIKGSHIFEIEAPLHKMAA